jgi:hypothetical protein
MIRKTIDAPLQKESKEKAQLRFIDVEFIDESTIKSKCKWILKLPPNFDEQEIIQIKKSTDQTIILKYPVKILLNKKPMIEGPLIYELYIRGRKYDNRCRWCIAFRKQIETRLRELDILFDLMNTCNLEGRRRVCV